MAKLTKEQQAKKKAILKRKSREGKPSKDRAEIARRELPMAKRYG